ncbi:MAG: M1 family peptidase, partial [Chitinophagaceae bacterium]
EGSGDMYNKGASLIHTIRQVINDDTLFRKILRGLNKDFYHKTVDSKDIENYFSKKSGKDFSKIFDQYLRTIKVPVFEYKIKGRNLTYRWTNCVDGFDMPLSIGNGKKFWFSAKTKWQTIKLPIQYKMEEVNKNFYITIRKSK